MIERKTPEPWKKKPGWLGFIGDDELSSYMGIIIKLLEGSLLNNQDSMENKAGVVWPWLTWAKRVSLQKGTSLFVCFKGHLSIPKRSQTRRIARQMLKTFTFLRITLAKFNSSPLKSYLPKRNSLPTTIFQGRAVKLRGCMSSNSPPFFCMQLI